MTHCDCVPCCWERIIWRSEPNFSGELQRFSADEAPAQISSSSKDLSWHRAAARLPSRPQNRTGRYGLLASDSDQPLPTFRVIKSVVASVKISVADDGRFCLEMILVLRPLAG
jgi:hypothetical protein